MRIFFKTLLFFLLFSQFIFAQKRTIYLSFDDGPLEGSEDIVAAVTRENVKINVFIVGENVYSSSRLKSYFELYEKASFVEISNHSYTHANDDYAHYYLNPEGVLSDISRNDDSLHFKNKMVRLPGRNMWRLPAKKRDDVPLGVSSADLLFKKGYTLFGWDLEWEHAKDGVPIQSVKKMLRLIDKSFRKNRTLTESHLVLLCHDEMFRNSWEESELKQLIETLNKNGLYTFEHLSKYPR